ncbi:hypothetical protein [Streptomyces sp. NBC_01092]|uniref:hypothetical protein n=1 Tax=Streptomyces sp. NBC_01092 TaxID=2903748 RepID=UPI00386BC96B|nr:hypothetical protein OG254_07180 [Streptomyces sp. NBC_01092]
MAVVLTFSGSDDSPDENPPAQSSTSGSPRPSFSIPTELPSKLPSELPTSLPSGFPTELPSGLPSDLESLLPSLADELP